MEQQTSVTTTTSTNVLSIQSSQQDTIVESTCAALISQAAAAVIGSSNISGSTTVIPPALALGTATGIGVSGGGSISSNISEAATGGVGVLKSILKTSAPVSPAATSNPPGKIFGRNNNGTMVVTSTPSNEAELQLYRVLQKASLLAYYDTLLEMGGDDVQQLCDAGEEEFLEIMALVGMASKPLHVRRLQKALHEYMTNPSAFQAPLPSIDKPRATYSPEPSTIMPHRPSARSFVGAQNYAPSPTSSTTPSTASSLSNLASNLQQVSTNTLQLTPSLTEMQVKRIMDAAERLSRTLPQLEPRPQSSKKKSTRDLELVILMDENDPQRMEEIRKYSAIYGRFDCKRKPEKPLTLHEVCVNEAAAQICKYIPALLTRRDELFPLARQVVRDAGFGHSTSIRLAALSNTQSSTPNRPMSDERDPKRTRLSSDTSSDMGKDYSDDIRDTPFSLYHRFDRPFDLSDASKFGYSRSEFDDTDSRFSFSNSSSSPMQTSNNGIDRESAEAEVLETHIKEEVRSKSADLLNPLGVQVISSSGGHIIAVANPALALSPALADVLPVKREVVSPELH